MPWWDNTAGFNEASGFPREWGAWGRGQFPVWLDRANRYGDNADWLQQQLQNYYWSGLNTDYASPEDIYGTGSRATPWINSGIDQMGQNSAAFNNAFAARPTVDSVYDPIYGRYNDWAGDISRTGEGSQSEIDSLARTLGGWNEGVNREIMGGIGDTFGRIDSGINDTFGGLRGASSRTGQDLLNATGQAYGGLRDASAGVFGGLQSSSDQTYGGLMDRTGTTFSGLQGDLGSTQGDIRQEIERLRPNSAFAEARAARNFAPVVANTAQRLRTLGLTPNSLQGMSAMADVESRRAAMMDDASIEQNRDVANRMTQLGQWGFGQRAGLGLGELDRMTDLGLGQQQGRERLGIQGLLNRQGLTEREQGIGRDLVTDALMRDINLGIGQNDRSNQSAMAALGMSNGERVRALMNNQGIANQRTGATLDNMMNQFNMTRDWRSSLNNADLSRYGANLNDLNMQRSQTDWNNSNAMRDIGLRNQQYGIGNEWWQNQYGRRDANAANLGNLMNSQYGQRQQANQNAMQWGNNAMNAYDTARNYDANRGNIGTRLLGGIGGSLLGMIPGVGPFLQGGVNSLFGGGAQQYQQPQRQSQSNGRSGGSSGAGYMVPRYSNTAAYPQVQNWNNFSTNMFGNMRMR